MDGFAFYYIESNLVCAIVFGILLIHNRFNLDRQEKQVKFDRALAAFLLYFLTDCFWAAIVSGMIPKTRFSVVSNTFLLYIFMAATTYYWLDYVMAVERIPNRNKPIHRFAAALPFLLSTLALIVNYIVAPQFLINDSLDTMPGFSVYLVAVPYIYLAAILFYTVRMAREDENHAEKRRHLFIGFFPLMTIAGGLVQMVLLPYAPIYCFTSMILMLIFYIQSIEYRVSQDPLTSLNNRGQLTRYCAQRANLYREGRQTVAIMMDIDGFKLINDNYGHAEGDRALMIVAEALKRAVNNHSTPCFLGRYGGDEFIMITHPVDLEEIDPFIGEVRSDIEKADTAYELILSAGYDALKGEQDTIQSCIERADRQLYLDKRHPR